MDRDGQATDKPVKANDDAADSLRYGVVAIRTDQAMPRIRSL